jgi:hypothetical protein
VDPEINPINSTFYFSSFEGNCCGILRSKTGADPIASNSKLFDVDSDTKKSLKNSIESESGFF